MSHLQGDQIIIIADARLVWGEEGGGKLGSLF
jgi:hypothetical protein